jgi:hypothetical protein
VHPDLVGSNLGGADEATDTSRPLVPLRFPYVSAARHPCGVFSWMLISMLETV